MENNVFEQMGAQGVESPVKPQEVAAEERAIDRSAETTLNVIAVITLVCGIIASVICLFTICWVKKDSYYSSETEFNPIGFGTTVGILLSSLMSWALLRVFANISNSLKDLNSKK